MEVRRAGEMGERSQEQDKDGIRDVELIDDGRSLYSRFQRGLWRKRRYRLAEAVLNWLDASEI